MNGLFDTYKLGNLVLNNRVVMAPMTRCRAVNNVPNELMVKYYGLRASAGLLITEGTAPSVNGLGYARIPGLFGEDQIKGWRRVTDAVHEKGGRIFVQLMHTGRVSHPLNMPADARILAPSATAHSGQMWTDQQGMQNFPVPAEMTETDILQAIDDFAKASEMAVKAGFDGVELHGANGYLIDQFLNTASNQRRDKWGGSVENRIRFAVETAKACIQKIGADRVGIRISPYGVFNDMKPDNEMDALYEKLSHELARLNLVYIHVVDHSAMGAPPVPASIKAKIRDLFKGTYILSGGYTLASAEADLKAQKGDLVAFGRPFISNPDLVSVLKKGLPLVEPDTSTFYTPGEKGYLD